MTLVENLPGHVSSSKLEPGHSAPPFIGAGLLQSLFLSFFPVSMLQSDQDPQAPQPSSTKKDKLAKD